MALNARSGTSKKQNTSYSGSERSSMQNDEAEPFYGRVYECESKDGGDFYLTIYFNEENKDKVYLNQKETKRGTYYESSDKTIRAEYKNAKKSGRVYLNIKFYDGKGDFLYSYKGAKTKKRTEKSPDFTIFKNSIFTAEEAAKKYPKQEKQKGKSSSDTPDSEYEDRMDYDEESSGDSGDDEIPF